jgi:hypothetical protein
VGLISKLLGRAPPDESASEPLAPNLRIEKSLGLQVLFEEPFRIDGARLATTVRAFHKSMTRAQCDVDVGPEPEQPPSGFIGGGNHVVMLIAVDRPMSAADVEACVAGAHYPQELKARARSHRAHVLLNYVGYDPSPFEQYVALACIAGVLGQLGGLVVLNHVARTSVPAPMLYGEGSSMDRLDLLTALPLPYLYCGFVKHEVEGVDGIWMRTYGARHLGLPDLAAHAAGHHEADRYFDFFDGVFDYLRQTGKQLRRSDTMELGSGNFVRVRAPKLSESFLERDGELFVLELIGADEINA